MTATTIPLRLGLDLRLLPDTLPEGDTRDPSPDEVARYTTTPAAAAPVTEWSGTEKRSGKVFRYRKVQLGNETVQAISVDDVTRRWIVDRDSNGAADLELVDNSGDAKPDYVVVYKRPVPMVEWRREALGEDDDRLAAEAIETLRRSQGVTRPRTKSADRPVPR
jgi:hypothetical protein